MATILGASRAWRTLQQTLAELNLQANQPADLPPLQQTLQEDLRHKQLQADTQTRQQFAPLEAEIEQEKARLRLAPAASLAALEDKLREVQLTLDLYHSDKSLLGRLGNGYRIRRQEKNQAHLQAEKTEIEQNLLRQLQEQDALLEKHRAELLAQSAHPHRTLNAQVALLNQILQSKELTEATLQHNAQKELQNLPHPACVLAGLQIETQQPARLDGKTYWRAEIDFLALTPAGLFAILVYGSAKPAENPYEQIRRGAHLCHELLKDQFPALNARAILAHRGASAPENPHSAVKTLPLGEINPYINWFQEKTLTDQDILSIAHFLQEPE